MKGGGLIRYPEIPIKLLKLSAQSGELACHASGFADVVVRAEEAVECGFDEARFCGTGTLSRSRQPRGHLLGEINANSGFHGRDSLKTRQERL